MSAETIEKTIRKAVEKATKEMENSFFLPWDALMCTHCQYIVKPCDSCANTRVEAIPALELGFEVKNH